MEIKAKILADSISEAGNRVTSFEIHLPKVLLAEYNTHAMISRNFSSSRAVPVSKAVEIDSFEPIYYGKNQAGMVAQKDEVDDIDLTKSLWKSAVESSKQYSELLSKQGLHKQWANRPNDWHVMAKGVTTATEWENFFWLRYDESAQPEIFELAKIMRHLMDFSIPSKLEHGEWHLPYIHTERNLAGKLLYVDSVEDKNISLEDAKMISMARCAAVSYRTESIGIEKAQDIYKKLFSGSKVHASPACHQATPIPKIKAISCQDYLNALQCTHGVTHLDRQMNLWSGNLKGWIQNRQLIPNNYKEG